MKHIKFLADVNIEKPIVDFLAESGFDIKWIQDYACDMRDEKLLSLARKENRILVTNDRDFGELVFLQRKLSTGIILFRVKGQKSHEKAKLMKKVIKHHDDKLLNHFTVISLKKIRIIPLEGIK